MTTSKKLASTAIAAVLALGVSGVASAEMAAGHEKCYGVSKAAKNDCGAASHACAGQSKVDGGKGEWIMLPKGTCDKLVGGSTAAGE